MDETRNLEFTPRVYEKGMVNQVLDRSFKQFGQVNEETTKTVEQFFQDYEDLFYQIPVEGETGSHQYLIEKSSQLYNAGNEMEDIQPLLDEITNLRSQSVQDQSTILELQARLNSSAAN